MENIKKINENIMKNLIKDETDITMFDVYIDSNVYIKNSNNVMCNIYDGSLYSKDNKYFV